MYLKRSIYVIIKDSKIKEFRKDRTQKKKKGETLSAPSVPADVKVLANHHAPAVVAIGGGGGSSAGPWGGEALEEAFDLRPSSVYLNTA
jgi:hypothetical protein